MNLALVMPHLEPPPEPVRSPVLAGHRLGHPDALPARGLVGLHGGGCAVAGAAVAGAIRQVRGLAHAWLYGSGAGPCLTRYSPSPGACYCKRKPPSGTTPTGAPTLLSLEVNYSVIRPRAQLWQSPPIASLPVALTLVSALAPGLVPWSRAPKGGEGGMVAPPDRETTDPGGVKYGSQDGWRFPPGRFSSTSEPPSSRSATGRDTANGCACYPRSRGRPGLPLPSSQSALGFTR
jgi:hypothetical protein